MSTSQHTAEVVIKGQTDGVSQKLKEVADGTTRVKKAADAAGDSQEAWGKKLDAIDKKMGNFTARIDQVTKVLGAAGLVGAAAGAAQAMVAMADRAQQITVANQALAISIEGARAATMGTVGDYELTVAANKAVQLGVVKTGAEFAKLSAVAAKLGIAMGQSAGQSVDDLTTALGRQSVMILDNLGISLKLEDAYTEYGARLGKTALQLTEAEKKQGFMTIALERAEIAAAKTSVVLDTHASKIQALSASYGNAKDQLTLFVTTALVTWEDKMGAANDLMDGWIRTLTGAPDPTQKATQSTEVLREEIHQTAQVFGIAAKEADLWAQALFGVDRQTSIMAGKAGEDTARQAWMDYRAGNEELRKTVALQKQRDALSRQSLEIDNKKKRGKGKASKPEEAVVNIDRFADANAGGDAATDDIQATINTDAYNESMQRQLILREDRIALIEQEQELAALGIEDQQLDADLQEDLAQRKYLAEQDLLDFQIAAAQTRAEILDLETAKRRKATQDQQRVMVAAQTAENKTLQQKRAAYERYGGAVGDVMGQVTIALIDSANGSEYAAQKALAAIATGIRNQMIMESLKEFALAVASAASFNYPAAAQHATAGGLAAAAAVVAGGFGAGISASIPSEPSTSGPSSSGGGSDRAGGSSSSKGGKDDDGVPTSYYDGGLYSKRPDRMPHAASGGGTINNNNITVLGATTDQVALALRRVQDHGERSLGRVR